jgi:peptidoglycan hydrolase-like protein with peptidoglycan-binding domain
MPNPEALASFLPYKLGEGPSATNKPVRLFTNLHGDAIRFTFNEDLGSIVTTATLTMLNAVPGDSTVDLGGVVNSDDDYTLFGKIINNATVEPNTIVYVTEIVGNDTDYTTYTEVVNGEDVTIYDAVGEGQVCQTYWRIVSSSFNTSDGGIPTCDIQLESLSKIAQECKIVATEMGSNDNSFILIEGTYLDSVFYFANLYSVEDGYQEVDTLAEFLKTLQSGQTITVTVPAPPYPNTFSLQYLPSSLMIDGRAYQGKVIAGIAMIQTFLVNQSFLTISYTPGTYDQATYNAVRAYQTKFHPPLSITGRVNTPSWSSMFPSTTTTQTVPPALLMVEVRGEIVNGVEYYSDYLDTFFNRIIDMGFNFPKFSDAELAAKKKYSYADNFVNISNTSPSYYGLKYIPLYTVYETGSVVWDVITNVFAFNGFNIRFRRDNSLCVWGTTQLQALDEIIDIGTYDTGLSLSYTKEGVINKASVKGWIGEADTGEIINKAVYSPPGIASSTYPNGKVYIELKTTNMKDGDVVSGVTISGISTIQTRLNVLGYKGANNAVLTVDGIFGANTVHAVSAFKSKMKLTISKGRVGPITWSKLFPVNTNTVMTRGQVATEVIKVKNLFVVRNAPNPDGTGLNGTYPYVPVGGTTALYHGTASSGTTETNATDKKKGYVFHFRYCDGRIDMNPSSTDLQKITSGGIWTCLYYEGGGYAYGTPRSQRNGTVELQRPWSGGTANGYSNGMHDAQIAYTQASNMGMPLGRPVYFACDSDPGAIGGAHMNACLEYYRGCRDYAHAHGYTVGAYGGYYLMKALFDSSIIDFGHECWAWCKVNGQHAYETRCQVREWNGGFYAFAQDYGQFKYHELPATANVVTTTDPNVPADTSLTDTTTAVVSWLMSTYPDIFGYLSTDSVDKNANLTWAMFIVFVNHYIDTIPPTVVINYWIPDSKTEHTTTAYSRLADSILNIDGYSKFAVSGEFEVPADYLLTSEDALIKYGEKEIFKTVISARTGSYTSNKLPLRAEVGMVVTGLSSLTGVTSLMIINLSRTTDVQQQTCSTVISGNIKKETGVVDSWV